MSDYTQSRNILVQEGWKGFHLKYSTSGKIKIKAFHKADFFLQICLGTLISLTIIALSTIDTKEINLMEAVMGLFESLGSMFLEAKLSHSTFFEALFQVGVTLSLAFLTTLIGAVLALFLSLYAARNLSKPWVSKTLRIIVAYARAVDTVVWVLIFAIAAGLGSVAAVIGMSFHTVSYLIKAYSESIEEMDSGVLEALQASGASFWQIVFQAVFPSTLTYLLSWTFLRFEINFTNAIAMGAAAGAGGIGFDLFMASGFYFDLREVGMLTYLILMVAFALEWISTQLKKRYLSHA